MFCRSAEAISYCSMGDVRARRRAEMEEEGRISQSRYNVEKTQFLTDR